MRKGKRSGTSSLVAFMRGLNTIGVTQVRGFSDPIAVHLLPPVSAGVLRGVAWVVKHQPNIAERIIKATGGALDAVALRSLAIDAAWAEAYQAGIRQLVLLGAGLDARAYRLPNLSDVRLFEVDHPATQTFKRQQAATLHPTAAALTYVPVDFAADDLGAALGAAGLQTALPSCWIWEGVISYLPPAATAATLQALATLAAAGSVLIATYVEPGTDTASASLRGILRWLGEPQLGLTKAADMAQVLRVTGWHLRSDEGLQQLSERYSDRPQGSSDRLRLRVAVAERPGGIAPVGP